MWDESYLWKHYSDQVIRRCVPETKFTSILTFYHSLAYGGHFGQKRTALKVLASGFYWPSLFKDAYLFCKSCDRCQRTCNLGPRNQMPQSPILIVEIFYVRASISWDHFLHHLVISIMSLRLIIFKNGWKQNPPELTILRLWQI